jgi:hypothetical protein
MWTGRRDAVRRRLYDGGGVRTGEAGFFFGDNGFDLFSGEDKGNEDSFAASAVFITIAVRSGRKTSESVAAIDQLFNVEEQVLILRHGNGQVRIGLTGKPYLTHCRRSLCSRNDFIAMSPIVRRYPIANTARTHDASQAARAGARHN